MPSEQIVQRMFFALWPDDKTRTAIATVIKKASQHHHGNSIRTDNLHLTLAFLGNINNAQRDCVEAVAESISITPFNLCLDHLGVFPKPRVLWLGVKEQPEALTQLATELRHGVEDCGIQLYDKGFNPHISLMRKVNRLHDVVVEAIHWQVNRFCLVQSVTHEEGVAYRVVKSW